MKNYKKGIAFSKLRTTTKFILENATAFNWSLQGLGMLRLHMADETRLHVWDLRFAFPGASPIHDHQQWALRSTVISGRLENHLYIEGSSGEDYRYATLKAGYNCYFKHDPMPIRLLHCTPAIYYPGDSYSQEPQEIHQTVPENGTVSIMVKTPTADPEAARVFWPAGSEWGSAEPRAATMAEVTEITRHALSRFDE